MIEGITNAYTVHEYRYVLWIITAFYIYFGLVKFIADIFSKIGGREFEGRILRYPWVIKNNTVSKIEQSILLLSIYSINFLAITILFIQ